METKSGQASIDRKIANGIVIFLAAVIFLVLGVAAGLKVSQLPRSNGPIVGEDLEIFDHNNGDGTYTTYSQTNSLARYGVVDWPGPTNGVWLTNQEYFFRIKGTMGFPNGVGDCYLSNIMTVPGITNTAKPVVFTFDNETDGATNITIRWSQAWLSPDGSRSLVVTNGQMAILSLRVNLRQAVDLLGTNIIGKIFY